MAIEGEAQVQDQGRNGGKSPQAFRTISEVAGSLDVPQHVLRFWESKFNQIKPLKRGGGRRYYRPEDVTLLRGIRNLLYRDGYTIRGVQKVLREVGVKSVIDVGRDAEDSGRKANLSLGGSRSQDIAIPASPAEGGGDSANPAEKRAKLRSVLGELREIQEILKKHA